MYKHEISEAKQVQSIFNSTKGEPMHPYLVCCRPHCFQMRFAPVLTALFWINCLFVSGGCWYQHSLVVCVSICLSVWIFWFCLFCLFSFVRITFDFGFGFVLVLVFYFYIFVYIKTLTLLNATECTNSKKVVANCCIAQARHICPFWRILLHFSRRGVCYTTWIMLRNSRISPLHIVAFGMVHV